MRRSSGISRCVRPWDVQFDRAAHRIDDAGKLGKEAVAGGLDDAAAMPGDLGVNDFSVKL